MIDGRHCFRMKASRDNLVTTTHTFRHSLVLVQYTCIFLFGNDVISIGSYVGILVIVTGHNGKVFYVGFLLVVWVGWFVLGIAYMILFCRFH